MSNRRFHIFQVDKNPSLQNSSDMIRGQSFQEMIWIFTQSQSYNPKLRVTGQKSELQLVGTGPRKIRTELSRKVPEWGLGAFTENPGKAFLNPPNTSPLFRHATNQGNNAATEL